MPPARHGHAPRYPLETIQRLAAAGKCHVTGSAIEGAAALFLDREDVLDCVLRLRGSDYSHTLAAVTRAGLFQDVYRPRFRGFRIYMKLQIVGPERSVVISFKQDTSP